MGNSSVSVKDPVIGEVSSVPHDRESPLSSGEEVWVERVRVVLSAPEGVVLRTGTVYISQLTQRRVVSKRKLSTPSSSQPAGGKGDSVTGHRSSLLPKKQGPP